jgi:hypothetical protein
MGYTNVEHYLEKGKQGWMEAGFPVEKAALEKRLGSHPGG